MSMKNNSSETMDLASGFYVLPPLPGSSSNNFQQDDFLCVEQNSLISSYNNIVVSLDLQKSYEGGSIFTEGMDASQIKNERGAPIYGNPTDLTEDVSYEYDVDQYDSTGGKLSHNKKRSTTNRKPSLKHIATSNMIYRRPLEQAFNVDMFDNATTEILKSIVSSSNYYTGNFGDIISKGKKSIVVFAYISKKDYPTWGPGVKPILMYATYNNEYNKRYRNWRSEQNAVKVYKLSDDDTKNESIFQQVQKEKEHLCLLHKAKCKVPEVKRCSRNIIVMSLVGTDGESATSIDTLARHPLKRSLEIYNIIVKDIDMWYKTLHVIHGALCSENVLYWEKEVHYVGWSHSVKTDHPQALKKIMKDCSFITKFFEARGVPVRSTEKLFKDITGLNEIYNSEVHSMDLWKSQHLTQEI